MKVNIGCGPHRAPSPWVNVDVIRVPGEIEPDVVTPTMAPADLRLVLTPEDITHVYLGHVLEHVPWDDVDTFLVEVRELLVPGGSVCVVGPDVYRTLDRWHAGIEPWSIVEAVLEGGHSYQAAGEWLGARHCWNAHEARVIEALDHAGFVNVEPRLLETLTWDWPVVSCAGWQCAITADTPA